MSTAFVFPGQGAQTIGMGRDLAEAYPAARAVFDEVDDALGEKLSALIWEGDIEALTLTEKEYQRMRDAAFTRHPETGEPIRRVITGGLGIMTSGKNTSPAPAASGGHCCGGGCGCG